MAAVRPASPRMERIGLQLYTVRNLTRRDPTRCFAAHRNRFRLCHLKDIDTRGRITEVGRGRLDFQRILSQRDQAGLRHFFVEHDMPRDPVASIRTSYEYLRKLSL